MFKPLTLALAFALVASALLAPVADAKRARSDSTETTSSETVQVKGYTRKDGTYVAPYTRTAPDSTRANNWTTQGNTNPYTGTAGTKPALANPYVAPGAVRAIGTRQWFNGREYMWNGADWVLVQ